MRNRSLFESRQSAGTRLHGVRIAAAALLLLAHTAFLGTSATAGEESPAERDSVQGFLRGHCLDCHGTKSPEAGVSLSGLNGVTNENAELWQRVLVQLATHRMPPHEEPRPAEGELREAAEWIEQQLVAAGHETDLHHKLRQPAYANLLHHETLFNGSQPGPAYSLPRFWRLHPEAYESFLLGFGRELTLGGPLSKPFTTGDDKGLASNYAGLAQADSATLGQLILNCKQIAQVQTLGFERTETDRRTQETTVRVHRRPPASFEAILTSEAAATEEQIAAAVAEEFQIVLGREPLAEEAAAYADLLKRSIEIGGKGPGLHNLAMAVLLRPEAIYRMEIGLGPADEHGRRMLSPYELAHAVAYALTDTPPGQLMLGPPRNGRPGAPSLLELAETGKLATREDVREVLNRMWETETLEKPRILRFFREFFGYHTVETVFKGDRADKEFNTRLLVRDADDLVMHHVREDRQVLKELLTTTRFFVQWPGSREEYEKRIKYITDRINPENTADRNYAYFITRVQKNLRPIPQANPTWRVTARFYNLDENTWDYPLEQPFEMPEGQRCGILTHPAWLAAWSGNFENDPIRRGKWIQEHLLAGSVPDVPITVDASVPQDPHKTLRERLQVTRQEYCWQCHRKMDPLGLPFEAYDDFGQFRTAEGLGETRALRRPKETAPVETGGAVIDSGDPALDGPVKNVHELMHRLAESPRVRQSFVRHAFRYFMGRNEMLSDAPTLAAAEKAYVENEGSFRALVLSLLTSDSFLYRKTPSNHQGEP